MRFFPSGGRRDDRHQRVRRYTPFAVDRSTPLRYLLFQKGVTHRKQWQNMFRPRSHLRFRAITEPATFLLFYPQTHVHLNKARGGWVGMWAPWRVKKSWQLPVSHNLLRAYCISAWVLCSGYFFYSLCRMTLPDFPAARAIEYAFELRTHTHAHLTPPGATARFRKLSPFVRRAFESIVLLYLLLDRCSVGGANDSKFGVSYDMTAIPCV